MLTIAPAFCADHDRRHQPRRPDDVHQVDVEAGVPLLVGDLEDRRPRAVAGAVDQHVDPAPSLQRRIDQALEVVVGLVRAGDADAAELGGERLALAGGGQDRHAVAVLREPLRRRGAHAAAARRSPSPPWPSSVSRPFCVAEPDLMPRAAEAGNSSLGPGACR